MELKKCFLTNVKCVPRSEVSKNANIIGSHTIYKLKLNEDESLKLKAHIPHPGKEDSDKDYMHTECCIRPPLGIHVVSSTATIRKWRSVRTDPEKAFMQTGKSQRYVHAHPPSESSFRNVLLLLVVSAYGLVNSNSKWQKQSDDEFISLGLQPSPELPQLFALFKEVKLVLLV